VTWAVALSITCLGLEKVPTHLTEDHTQPLDISRAQQVEHALPYSGHVRRACRRQFLGTRVGQLRISAPLVVDTLDPAHPPGTDQPIDGPGHTTSGRHHSVGELTHAQLPAGRFGESDQQFEIGEGNVGVSHQLLIENTLAARMVLAPDVSSVDYQVRAANGVVYVLGIAKSRTELDQVIALARVSGARKIVSHVFLSEHIVLDVAPEPTAEAKAEPEPVRAGGGPARVGTQTNEIKTKPAAKAAKKKPAPLPAPPQTATR